MGTIRRRQLLKGSAVLAGSALAGCNTGVNPDRDAEDDADEDRPTASPESSHAGINELSYSAEVLEQQSPSTPATIRSELTNTSEQDAKIAARETIVLRYDDGPDYNLLLFPETEIGPNDPPNDSDEGCWRYTDSDVLARDIEEWHTIESGGAHQETYRLFTRGEDRMCLPDGAYQFTATVRDEDHTELQVSVAVSITDSHVSVEGSAQSLR